MEKIGKTNGKNMKKSMEHHGTIKKLYDFQILKNNAGLDYQRVNGKYLHYCLGL
jgi:hypothetical protein